MAFSEVLRMLIQADTGQAVRNISAVGVATDKSLGGSQKTIDKWSRGLTVAGAGMVALGGAALFGLGKAAMASEEAELGFRKLQNSIANNPRLAAESAVAFRDLAESIQDKTAADADSIVAGQAVLAQRKLDAAQIKELTPLIVDLARKKGIDEVAAFTLASKAVDGNAGALKRAGISIDEAAFKSDAFGATVEALRSSVGGYAEEEGATFQGSLERTKNKLGDLVEGVGAGAVDAFGDLLGVVGAGTDKLNDLSPAAQGAIGKFLTFGSVAVVVAGGLSFVAGQLLTARNRFHELADAAAAARLRMAGFSAVVGPLGVSAALIAAGGAFATYLKNQKHEEILEAAKAFAELEGASSKAAAATGVVNDAVKVSTIDFTASASAADTLAESGKLTDQAIRDLDNAFGLLLEKAPASAEAFIKQAEAQGVSREKLAEWRGELQGKISDDADAVTAQDEYTASVQEAAGATEEATSALQEYSDQISAMTDPLFAAMDAITGVRDAQLAHRDAAAAVVEAQLALNEAQAGGTEEEVAEATRGLADAKRDLSDASFGTVEAAREQDQALAALKDALDTGVVSTAEFRETLKTWVAQGSLTQAQADDAARSVGALADEASAADKERVDIPVETPGSTTSRTELRRVRDSALDVPTRTNTNVGVTGARSAISLIDQVSTRIRQLDGSTANVNINARATSTGRIGGVPIFHEGTHRVPGPPGSEMLAIVQAGEQIISASQVGRGGGSGPTYMDNRHVTYEIHGGDPKATVEAIKRYERSNGTGWRN